MVKKFLNFDQMITPTIIKIVFWIGAALSVLSGIVIIISGITSYIGGAGEVFMGLLIMILGPFVVRIYCELLIIFFKMNETMTEIKEQLSTQKPAITSEKKDDQ